MAGQSNSDNVPTDLHQPSPRLTVAGQTYTIADLMQGPPVDFIPNYAEFSENTQHTLDFCYQWVMGVEQFTVHTSGSTGKPKPIAIQRIQMVYSAQATGSALGLQPGQHMIVCLPTRFIAGRMMLVRGFVLGMHMTVVEPASDPFAQLAAQETYFDFTAVVPLQLQTLLDSPPSYLRRLNKMQSILVGGAPVSVALEAKLQNLEVPIYHTFGMTETVTHFALRHLNPCSKARNSEVHSVKKFRPLPNVKLTTDDRGCLAVSSPITLGKRLQTNDSVVLGDDGSFIWLGRWDNVINSGGIKVQIETVETELAKVFYRLDQKSLLKPTNYSDKRNDFVNETHFALSLSERRFFVAALPDTRLGETVGVVLEGYSLQMSQEEEICGELKKTLAYYEIPRQFVYCTKFAETPTGKIDRKATLNQISHYDLCN
ncbi:MAG: AMP-binding protein [Chloroflexota bacterium]